MKKQSYLLVLVLALTAILISACGGSAAISAPNSSAVGGGKPQASPVQFTGVIEAINGNEWSINGQTITVDPAVVRDGPFNVGDTVKVEVNVQPDGSMVVNRVETPDLAVVVPSSSPDASGTPDDSSLPISTPDPVSSSTPDPASTTVPDITFDNQGNEAFGTVTSIDGNTIVIGGQTFQLADNAEIKFQLQSGASVKVHFILNADGTMTITEVQSFDPTQSADDNLGSNSGSGDQNDDNSNLDSSSDGQNDDNSNSDSGSDDKNDDNSNSDSSHDDSPSNNDSGIHS